ncbi:molybdate ABC transporter substrate-binding protein [Halomonas halocynthiae]|uniref:molybdate ABC transporter substrate-binding protein n=1 Tax=Halomonas halocynthiae TaxID=176290 RepID=UPI000421F6B1|nr:molybdate ABC transporter substrate-binding protein [Halomonas halocynthiae]
MPLSKGQWFALATGGIAIVLNASVQAGERVHLLAAASLTNAVDEAVALYRETTDVDVVSVYASSSTLARQIANGAPADIYLSANTRWMDWLDEEGVALSERKDLLNNRLVLVAPLGSPIDALQPGEDGALIDALADGERMAVGDPDHVPAGLYTKEALESLGEWEALAPRLARADNVRAALALVERGEVPLGAVYRTDGQASDKVKELGVFPQYSHTPVTYLIALISDGVEMSPSAEAQALREWLGGAQAREVFERHGFSAADADDL